MISFSKLTNVYKGNCVINIKIQFYTIVYSFFVWTLTIFVLNTIFHYLQTA